MVRRAMPYRDAIEFLWANDDNTWLDEIEGGEEVYPSVSAVIVAEIYGRTSEEITADLLRIHKRRSQE